MAVVYLSLILEIFALSVISKTQYKYKKFFPYIIMLSLSMVMGLRYNVGIDYPVYEEVFNDPYSWHRDSMEKIWLISMDSLRSLSFKARMFFFLTSLLYVYGYYIGFKRLSPQIYLSFIIFIAIGTYGEGSNTIRQTCAQAVLFAGSYYFLNNKWKKFFPYALCAVFLHFSALIGLFLMWICRVKVKSWILYSVLVLSFIAGPILMNKLLSLLTAVLIVINKYQYSPDSFDPGVSTGTLRIFYTLIGVVMVLLSQKIDKRKLPAWFFISLNLVVIGIVIYNIFYLFLPVNRLNKYCLPFLTILFPIICTKIKRPSRYIIEGTVISGFLLFYLKALVSTYYDFDIYFL